MIYVPDTRNLDPKHVGHYCNFTWTAPNTNNHPFLHAIQEIMHCPSWNMTFQGKNLFWNGLNDDDIADLFEQQYCGASFNQLMDNRARDLASRARELNVPVRFLWSGGLDSTAALLASAHILEENNVPYKVICTPLAEREYARLFHQLQNNGVMELVSHIGLFDYICDTYRESIVVTGYCGDQLGSSMVATCYGLDLDRIIRTPWQKFIMHLFPDAYDPISKMVKASGLTIRNSFDLGWLMNLILKWDCVSYSAIFWAASRDGVGTRLPLAHNFSFYDTIDFRLFAIDYYKQHGLFHRTKNRPFTKQFILDKTGDVEYFQNKMKDATMFDIRPSTGIVQGNDAVIIYCESDAVRVEQW